MDNIIRLFKDHGTYSKELQFKLIIIIITIVIVLNYYFKSNITNIIILSLFAFYIANIYLEFTNKVTDDSNKVLLYKLNKIKETNKKNIEIKLNRIKNSKIHKRDLELVIKKIYNDNNLDYLYTDSNLISFIYSILPLSQWNSDEFFSFLKGVNNILKLKYEIDNYYTQNNKYPINTSEMLQLSLQLRVNTTNNLHNFIYTIPKVKEMTNYIDNILKRYSILINYNISSIYNSHKKNISIIGINNQTKFVNVNDPTPLPNNNNMVYI